MSELSPQQAEALGLPPGGPSAELSPAEAHALGLPPGGPAAPPVPHSGVADTATKAFGWLEGADPDAPVGPPEWGDTGRTITNRAVGFATGMSMPNIPGVAKAAGWVGKKIGAAAEPLIAKFTNAIGDRSAAAAEATARSATGAFGKSVSEGSNTLKRLGMNEGLEAADVAANQAALQTPEAKELAAKLAGKAREALPEQLGRMETAEALATQARADAAAARSPQAIDTAAAEMRKNAIKTLATRYLAPGAGGAAVGWALGGDEHGGSGALGGAAMGLLHRPAIGFASRQIVKSPAFGLPLAKAAASTGERLAAMAQARTPELGRFGPILSAALREGPQSFAAHSYALGQSDPDFQNLQQKMAENK